jgi:hypothetical protein
VACGTGLSWCGSRGCSSITVQTYTHDEMLELLRTAAAEFDGGSQQSLATFWSGDKERFVAAPDGEVVPADFDFSDGVEEHRQIVFVDAQNF